VVVADKTPFHALACCLLWTGDEPEHRGFPDALGQEQPTREDAGLEQSQQPVDEASPQADAPVRLRRQ